MNNSRSVFIFKNKNKMLSFIVEKWREIANESIIRKGYFSVALSGGTTPLYLYSELARLKKELPWDKTHIFIVDERHVPLTGRDSNYRMIKKTLLEKVNINKDDVHYIPTDESSPLNSAKKYEEVLRNFFNIPEDEFPELDLILLGIGEDGHTASLFPGSGVLKDRVHLAASVMLGKQKHNRITLTLPVINRAGNIIFLVTGKNKASVVKAVIEEKDSSLPASLVKPENGRLLFVLDNEAGSYLAEVKR